MSILWQLFMSFSKIGLFSLGGGSTLIKLIEQEFVQQLKWLSAPEFSEYVGVSFAFPGFSAVKIAALIGYQFGGVGGLFVSVVALNIYGILLCLGFYTLVSAYKNNPWVIKAFDALKYMAVVCLFSAGLSLLEPLTVSKKSIILPLAALVGLNIFQLSVMLVLPLFILIWVVLP